MLTRAQRIERLRNRLAELELWLDRASLDLRGWRFEGDPIEIGAVWPRRDGLVRLELASARVPDGWPLAETSLEVAPGGEGLLRVQYGSRARQFGVDPWHRRFPLREAAFALSVEAVARLPFGRPIPEPRLEAGRMVWVEVGLARLVRRLRLLADAAAALGEDDAAELLISAGERSLSHVLWPSGSEGYLGRAARDPELAELWTPPRPAESPEPLSEASRESVRAADAFLGAELVRIRGEFPPRGRLGLTAHAHSDLAWLWPLQETDR